MVVIVPVTVFLVATALLAFAGVRFVTARDVDLDQRLQDVIVANVVKRCLRAEGS